MKISFEDFKDQIRATESRRGNRTMDYCDWHLGDQRVFHERVYWTRSRPNKKSLNPTPAEQYSSLMNEPRFQYWSETIYSDLNLAKKDAKKFGGVVQQGFYCEEPDLYWFLIFDDLDRAIMHAYDTLIREIQT